MRIVVQLFFQSILVDPRDPQAGRALPAPYPVVPQLPIRGFPLLLFNRHCFEFRLFRGDFGLDVFPTCLRKCILLRARRRVHLVTQLLDRRPTMNGFFTRD